MLLVLAQTIQLPGPIALRVCGNTLTPPESEIKCNRGRKSGDTAKMSKVSLSPATRAPKTIPGCSWSGTLMIRLCGFAGLYTRLHLVVLELRRACTFGLKLASCLTVLKLALGWW